MELFFPYFRGFYQSDDDNEVARRALVQILAIRAWPLRHGGRSPEKLEDLVPDELPGLPLDPYSGRPFGVIRARADIPGPPAYDPAAPGQTELRQLYSVGPDGLAQPFSVRKDDIVFSIPAPKSAEKRL